MKSKSLTGFWVRWLAGATLHTFLYSWIWSIYPFYESALTLGLFEFASGVFLNSVQYWAIPFPMRPSAKRWFSASILTHLLSRSILYFSYDGTIFVSYELGLVISYLPLAIALSWALSERYHKSWIYGIAIGFAALYQFSLVGRLVPPDLSQMALYLAVWDIGKAIVMGLGLYILLKYFLKEASILSAS